MPKQNKTNDLFSLVSSLGRGPALSALEEDENPPLPHPHHSLKYPNSMTLYLNKTTLSSQWVMVFCLEELLMFL